MILCCSARLIKETGLVKSQLSVGSRISETLLDKWYARLFFYDRKKCVLFTNSKTLFSFVAMGVRRQQLKNLAELFIKELILAFKNENFTPNEIEKMMLICKDFQYGKSTDKSVIGSMNDLVQNYKSDIYVQGLKGRIDFAEIGKRLNRIPMSPLGMKYAIEAFLSFLSPHS